MSDEREREVCEDHGPTCQRLCRGIHVTTSHLLESTYLPIIHKYIFTLKLKLSLKFAFDPRMEGKEHILANAFLGFS